MNNCRIQLELVEDKWICTIDSLKKNEWQEFSFLVPPEELPALQNLIKFINE